MGLPNWVFRAGVVLAMVFSGGCNCQGAVSGGEKVPAPTVEDPPAKTRTTPLAVRGTKEKGVHVLIQLESEPDFAATTAGPDQTTWSHLLDLAEGQNRFVVVAIDDWDTSSDVVGPFEVVLDTIPPRQPTLDAYPETVLMSPGADSTELVFTGTKDADASLIINGSQAIPVDGQLEWSATVILNAGQNTIGFVCADDVGNESAPLEVFIYASDVLTPTLDPVALLTNETPAALSGEKGTDTGIFIRDPDETGEQEIVPIDSEITWSYPLDLTEGENVFLLYARNQAGRQSMEIGPTTIVLDTIAPPAPTLDPATPGLVTEEYLMISGQKGEDGDICLRQNAALTCSPIIAIDGRDTFTVEVGLIEGSNSLCFGSKDAAGNASTETCIDIMYTAPPNVLFVRPPDRGVVDTADVAVEVVVLSTTATVIDVQFCVDSVCNSGTQVGSTEYWTGTATIASPVNGHGYEIEAFATDDVTLSGQASRTVLYLTETLVISDNLIEEPSRSPQVAVDLDGNIDIVWHDNCWIVDCGIGSPTTPYDIFYRRWDGVTWTATLNISDVAGEANAREPAAVADTNGNVHIAWQDDGDIDGSGFDRDVVHRIISGVTGQLGVASLVTVGSNNDDLKPRLAAAPDGTVHIVWERDVVSSNHDIYHAVWSAGSWGVSLLISNDAEDGNSRNPDVAVDSQGVAYVVWQDNGDIAGSGTDEDIFLRTVTNGTVLGEIVLVTDDANDGESRVPAVAVGPDDSAHVVWHETGDIPPSGSDLDIWYRSFDPTQPPVSRLSAYELVSGDAADGISDSPAIAVDQASGYVYVAWTDNGDIASSGSDYDIFYSVRQGGGFGLPVLVSNNNPANTENSFSPHIAVVPGQNLHLVWEDQSELAGNGTDWDVCFSAVPVQ